ncbi:dephospho-CoA kinase [Candidatus Palibaumannia cicadellinicola]|uniref:Dephospho-CoA kinase n=1 Tax=Candidatus Palibaumannia cicadellinicola TaxID=186490 RepID=A0A088NBC2_9GAMM|nr:dephospho-CoA kinase [Candidatus Baumannia cicadellinicola]AIN47428.1 Dephospho-CoA kinase [Candidatus Baumannia cicadellinicola]
MPYVVALTGGIGSGKSTVANIFEALGTPIVDADVISRQIVQPHSKALHFIINRFGSIMLYNNGMLNRTALREQIFSNPEDKVWLNNLLHPIIQQLTEQQIHISYADAPYVLWVVPLLLENNLQQHADRILVVDVSIEKQITRTLIRDNISNKQVENILSAQISHQQRLYYADDIIDNNRSLEETKKHIIKLNNLYLKLAAFKRKQKQNKDTYISDL